MSLQSQCLVVPVGSDYFLFPSAQFPWENAIGPFEESWEKGSQDKFWQRTKVLPPIYFIFKHSEVGQPVAQVCARPIVLVALHGGDHALPPAVERQHLAPATGSQLFPLRLGFPIQGLQFPRDV